MRSVAIVALGLLGFWCGGGSSPPAKTEAVVEFYGPPTTAIDIEQYYCIDVGYYVLKQQWPVDKAVESWNENGVNFLTTNDEIENCRSTILITTGDEVEQEYGHAEKFGRNIYSVQLSSFTPVDKRLSTLCHELGHALGFDHSNGDGSCMDPNQDNEYPTKEDLRKISERP